MNKSCVLGGVAVTIFFLTGCGKHNAIQSKAPFESEEAVDDVNSTLSNEVAAPPDGEPAAVNVNGMTARAPVETAAFDPSAPFVKPTDQEVQQALQNAGVYNGKVDGVVGPRTKKAIRDFQTQNNLKADGRVGPQTWAALRQHLHQQPQTAAPAVPAAAASVD